ncbi:hypothetical protein LCGC14_1113310 [marine sediment metagenome]|uniref:Wadjet protein JetD C-terminal domain-containing protein n=1 Tax=marine sediment metagenome TaxID=412755 RepID=A0A0F9QC65_9ZZZZ|nr:DUF2399 domain-containing protein [Methylophaga sp.]HEC58938.1 DUF2399 domain-containing protein [Methylophaga sp.]
MSGTALVMSILTSLITKSDKHHERNAKISSKEVLMAPYRNQKPIGMVDEVNRLLASYESRGLITITWHVRNVSIKFIRLNDGDQLATDLNIKRYSQRYSESLNLLDNTFSQGVYPDIRQDIISKWQQYATYEGFHADDVDKVILAIKGADAVLEREDKTQDIDYRHLSVNAFSDSKELDKNIGSIARILKVINTEIEPSLEAKDVLQLYGVVPIAHPVYISGQLTFISGSSTLNASFPPAVGIWPMAVDKIMSNDKVNRVTSIENLATFMRYVCNEKAEDEVVLYTGGIPSPACRTVYKMIVYALPNSKFYHWGDIDLGGFIILSMMEKIAGRSVLAFRMSTDNYKDNDQQDTFSTREINRLNALTLSKDNHELLKNIIAVGHKFEQEAYY